MKLKTDFTRVHNLGRGKWRDLLKETVDEKKIFGKDIEVSEEAFTQWADDLFDEYSVHFGVASTAKGTRLDVSRTLQFLDGKAELAFFREVGPADRDILRAAIGHQVDRVKKAKLQQLHGDDLELAINSMKDLVAKRSGAYTAKNAEELDGVIEFGAQSAQLRTVHSAASDAEKAIVDTLSNVASASLTGKSALRNVFWDLTFHSAWIRKNMKQNSYLMELMSTTWGLGKNITRGLTDLASKEKKLANFSKFLESNGASIEISGNFIAQGELAMSRTIRGNDNITQKVARKLAETVSMIGGADLTNRASRVQTTVLALDLINRADNASVDYYRKISGMSVEELDFVRKMPKIKYKGTDMFPDWKAAGEVPTKGKFESKTRALQRVKTNYNNLLNTMTNDVSAISRLEGKVAPKGWPMVSLVTKFWGITLSQYQAFFRATRLGAGLDPDAGITLASHWEYAKANPVKAFGLLSLMATAGYSTGIIYDLAQGREIREPSPETLALGALNTGLGGVPGMMFTSLYYNNDILGTPITPFAQTAKSAFHAATSDRNQGAKLKKAGKRALKLVPGANLWYSNQALKALGIDMNEKPVKRRRR